MNALKEVPKRSVLNSWKEIGAYLGATARSVQRWEKESGLPIHRQGSGIRARVYAYSGEIDRWRETGTVEAEPPETPARRGKVISIAAVALIGVAIAAVWFFMPARKPAAWKIENSTLTVSDAAGRVCWSRVLPALDDSFESQVHDKALIADIDDDGRVEVLFNMLPTNLGQTGGSLRCYEQKGALRWEFHYGAEKQFGGRTFAPSYRGKLIRVARIGGRPHVLTAANHYIWYPSQTALLDPKTGRLEEEYWHPGAVSRAVLHDIDGDGQDELLLGTINNPGHGLGHAALAVLKLPFSKARPASPNTLTGGGEHAYLLFPLPDVSRITGVLPIPWDLTVDPQHRIMLEVPVGESAAWVIHLNADLSVSDFRVSDNFALLHNRFFAQHLLDHAFSPAELAALGKPVHFDAAPDGNSPALRRFWTY